jgi:transcriptional accessory protein Tex/SPT6
MVERRYAPEDGLPYTQAEFEGYYPAEEWKEKWDNSELAPDMKGFEDFSMGEEVEAKVMRLAPFGAFCDIGATTDALLHISQISNEFIADINDKLSEGDVLKVTIKELDAARGRIGLTMRTDDGGAAPARSLRPDAKPISDVKVGDEVEGKVLRIANFGAFVDIGCQKDGLLHISEVADEFVSDINEKLSVGQTIKCRVKEVDMDKERIGLSCKGQGGGDSGGSDASSYYYSSK